MSSEQIKKAVAVCEKCWIDKHSKWEPESVDDKGNIKLRLTGVTTPYFGVRGVVEICTLCGKVTIAGIYDSEEPTVVYGVDSFGDYSDYTGFSAVGEEPDEEEEL